MYNKIQEYYDVIAQAIRTFLDQQPDAGDIYAMPCNTEKLLEREIIELLNTKYSCPVSILKSLEQRDSYFIKVFIVKLEEHAYRLFEKWMLKWSADFDDCREIDGLNSVQNQFETRLLLMPKFRCMWEGNSGQSNHCLDVNTFLRHSYVAELENGKIGGKYKVKNYVMNTSLYAGCLDSQNENTLTAGLSPVTEHISLSCQTYIKNKNGRETNCFSVNMHDDKTEKELVDQIQNVLRKADERGIEVFVFPEMLGTNQMPEKIAAMLQEKSLDSIKFFVLPSIWENNTNRSYVLNYCGDIIFVQDKLKKYPWPDTETGEYYNEDIIEGDVIHLIHITGYGSVAVLICRSELDTASREILIQTLNVKLLLCPSWSPGSSHEFEVSIMGGAEKCCNTVWCNTCSALRDKNSSDKVVGIISGYGKNKQLSQLDFHHRKFPEESIDIEAESFRIAGITDSGERQRLNEKIENERICKHCCSQGCIFQEKIYGTDCLPEEEEGFE